MKLTASLRYAYWTGLCGNYDILCVVLYYVYVLTYSTFDKKVVSNPIQYFFILLCSRTVYTVHFSALAKSLIHRYFWEAIFHYSQKIHQLMFFYNVAKKSEFFNSFSGQISTS